MEALEGNELACTFRMLVERLDDLQARVAESAAAHTRTVVLNQHRHTMTELRDPATLGLPIGFPRVRNLAVGMVGTSRCVLAVVLALRFTQPSFLPVKAGCRRSSMHAVGCWWTSALSAGTCSAP